MSGGSQYFLNMVVHAAIPNHFVSACEVIVVDTTLKVKKISKNIFFKSWMSGGPTPSRGQISGASDCW